MAIAFRDSETGESASSAPATLTIPVDILADDFMVAALTMYAGAGEQTATTPAGWTLSVGPVVGAGTFGSKVYVYTRVATGGDAGSTLSIALSANARWALCLSAYSGVDTTSPINVTGQAVSSGDGTTATSASVTTTVDGCEIIECFGCCSNANTTISYTAPATGRGSPSDNQFVAGCLSDQPQVTAGATGTQTGTLSHSGSWEVVTVALAPTGSGLSRTLADGAAAADTLTIGDVAVSRSLADGAAAAEAAPVATRALADGAAAAESSTSSGASPRTLADGAASVDVLARAAYIGVGPLTVTRHRTGTATPSAFRSVGPLSAARTREGWCVPQVANQVRWRLDDPTDGHNWVFETNPNSGGSPHYKRNVTSTPTTAADGKMIHSQGDDDLPTSQFTVILRTQAGFDQLRDWYRRCQTHPVLLTDDLGRRTYIVFTKRAATRKPGARRAWKMEYAVDYLIWQEVTA